MRHFLLIYDRRAGRLVEFEEYDDYQAALSERFQRERDLGADSGFEIVVLSSPSSENLQRTHARYFRSIREQLASGAEPAPA